MTNRTASLDFRTTEEDSGVQCHLMPCRVEHKDLSIKSIEYFLPTIRKLESGGDDEKGRNKDTHESEGQKSGTDPILAASFRGRPLHGRKVTLPDQFLGHVVAKDPRSTSVPTKKFQQFTYWNWDSLPSRDDEIMKAIQWIPIAKAIHGE